MKFKECPYCGSNLDFGEQCDCQNEQEVAKHETEEAEGDQKKEGKAA